MRAILRNFLCSHWNNQSPLLVALSGGPDSRLLLQLLLEIQKEIQFQLAIAHVDHRWRISSQAEAAQLQELAEQKGLIFHLKVLDPTALTGNLEAACRDERYKFFRQLCDKNHYQAVLLGHHADDQAETVLKRLFEGSSLPRLTALRPVTTLDGLNLWRPLLSIWKKDLICELTKQNISAFTDETNHDPRFLRGRLRTSLLPLLSKEFGKEISSHLRNLSDEAHELQSYLDRKIAPFLHNEIKGPFGLMLNLQDNLPRETLEQKHLIQAFCNRAGLRLSKEALMTATKLLAKGAAGKAISCGSKILCIDRYCLFALEQTGMDASHSLKLTEGTHLLGKWEVTVQELSPKEAQNSLSTDWQSVWIGNANAILNAESVYTLAFPQKGESYPRSSLLSKWWNNAKIPAFLRPLVPVIYENDKVVHEFLSGRSTAQLEQNATALSIKLNWADNHKLLLIANQRYGKIARGRNT
jgi:tRNA(Ile)-lysidine synthase